MNRPQRQSRFESSNEVVVMKFGGTSVEDTAAVRRLIGIVQSRLDAQPVVVVSALARVTNQLLEAGRAAVDGRFGLALDIVRAIYVRHERLSDDLVEGPAQRALDAELRAEFQRLESLLHNLDASRKLDLPAQDRLLGFGECLSSKLLTAALSAAGITAGHVDARTCILTDSQYGEASPLWDATNERIQEVLTPLLESGVVPILGGFIASDEGGVPTTLGRGGSDLTATIVGAALGAWRIEIWTDVDGIMTADPKLCPEARVIRKMSFDEAAELARLGAKVLHPATLVPAIRENIPVHVLNSRRPEGEGTEITARPRSGDAVRAVTAKRRVAAVEIESIHAIGSQLLDDVYAAFDRHACPVEVMAVSPGRISLLVGFSENLPAIAMELKDAARVRWENHKALVCVVGESIRRQPELASRAFASVSELQVCVCQGVSDRTLSFLVEESRVEEAVQRLHAVFFAPAEISRDWGGISSAYCQAG